MSIEANPSIPPRPDLSSYLTEQLLELIHRGKFKPGDRLPSTRTLAERFSVATPTLREALRRLQATGVVDIRHGSGIYVRHGAERFVLANPHHAKLELNALLHLLDARLLIEPHLAELAARHATEADLITFEHILNEAKTRLGDQDQQLHKANMGFHVAIAAASGNRVLHHVMESLIELFVSEQLAILGLYDARSRDYQQHRSILASIRERAPARARQRMAEHLRDVRIAVESSLVTTISSEAGPSPKEAIGASDDRRSDGVIRSPA